MRTAARQITTIVAAFTLLLSAAIASAMSLDLTVAGSSGSIGDALFSTNDQHPTGTGYINPFLRIQANRNEQGYNTDAKSPPMDDKAGLWTHSLQLGNLVSSDGYYKFLLDINQTAANPQLDLTDVRFFLGGTGDSALNNFSELGTQVWAFGASDVVHMNYLLNPGSGWGDIYMYIPTDVFAGYDPSTYLTLYSKFGGSNDGFEEWATMTSTPPPPVPEPGTFLLLGTGFLGLAVFSKRRRQNA